MKLVVEAVHRSKMVNSAQLIYHSNRQPHSLIFCRRPPPGLRSNRPFASLRRYCVDQGLDLAKVWQMEHIGKGFWIFLSSPQPYFIFDKGSLPHQYFSYLNTFKKCKRCRCVKSLDDSSTVVELDSVWAFPLSSLDTKRFHNYEADRW